MTREEIEQLIAAKLYDEISEEQCRILEKWFDHNPADRQEYEELQKTHQWLSRLSDVPASVVPLRAETIAGKKSGRGSWRRWAAAMAACFALGLICSWRGFEVQLGPVRLACGPALDETALRKEIAQEIADTYVPIFQNVAATMSKMRDDMQLTAQQQNDLDQKIRVLTALRNVDKDMDNRLLEKFTNELGRELDNRMKYLARPVVYNPQNFSNSHPVESPK